MILSNAKIATMTSEPDEADSIGLITEGAMVVEGERISWVGESARLPDHYRRTLPTIDCQGRLITPGLVDCHTHLVYGGNRAREFELRLNGASYAEIAEAGGGIVSTVSATRKADENTLFNESLPRLERLMSEGVTTVEIKSGYGLDTQNEMKMLSVAKRLGEHTGVRVQKTFLAAHALPPEYDGDKAGYIQAVCEEMLPQAQGAGLVDAVDGFCESIAFSVEQIERVFDAAGSYGLAIKLHAEQLSDLGGAMMAARRGALSVDHLEYLSLEGVKVLSEHETVAVLLPGAFYFLGETQLPPIAELIDHRVPIAIASDCNPGSSPLTSLLLAMNMACTFFRLPPALALKGVTLHAAQALGLAHQIGSIESGKFADLVIWDADEPASLAYHIGLNPCNGVMIGGQWTQYPSNFNSALA